MTAAVLATLLLASTPAAPCSLPADCGADGVCVAGTCRAGVDRGTIAVLHDIAIEPPAALGGGAALAAQAKEIGDQLATDLVWTGFYELVPPSRLGAATRRVVARLDPGLDPGSYRLRLSAADVKTSRAVLLPEGDVMVRPGGARRAVARWVSALVAHDTGIPSPVATRVAATVEVKPGIKEIAILDVDGRAFQWVTATGSLNLGPAWGPGGVVGYMSYASGNPDWVVEGRPLSTRPGLNAAGAWSPDGSLLALSVVDGENSDIVVLDAATGEEHLQLTSHPAVDTSPSWSPDGSRIAFVSDRSRSPQIWIAGLDGSPPKRVTSGGYITSPDWSPLGDALVYTVQVGGGFAIVRHDLTTGRSSRLTSGSPSTESPSFSPDGRYIVFARRNGRRSAELWLMDADGKRPRALGGPDMPTFAPDWQRAGEP